MYVSDGFTHAADAMHEPSVTNQDRVAHRDVGLLDAYVGRKAAPDVGDLLIEPHVEALVLILELEVMAAWGEPGSDGPHARAVIE